MGDALADAFRSEMPCEPRDAALLASLVRERPARLGGGPEDSDADLVVRLRDPRTFGAFAEAVLDEGRVAPGLRTALLEHAPECGFHVPRAHAGLFCDDVPQGVLLSLQGERTFLRILRGRTVVTYVL